MDKADSYLSIPLLSNDRTGNDDEDDETVFQNDVLDLSLSSGIDILNESRKLSQNIGERSVREIRNINQARTSDAETGFPPKLPRAWFQVHWIPVLLCTTLLLWLAWSGITEIVLLKHDLYTRDSLISRFVLKDRCTGYKLEDLDRILSAFNLGEEDQLLDLKHCATEIIGQMTTKRLQLRMLFRKNKTVPSSLLQYSSVRSEHPLRYIFPQVLKENPGLGNWIFLLASAYGISRNSGPLWRPAMLQPHDRENYFTHLHIEKKSLIEAFGTADLEKVKNFTYQVEPWARYNPIVENISKCEFPSVMLDGYLQVLRYFDQYREDIRHLFTFNDQIMRSAISVIQERVGKYMELPSAGHLTRLPNLVGIHVRRGDILREPHRTHGHEPASEFYLLKAALYMQMHHAPVLFMVLSNDIEYCRGVFKGDNFLFIEHHPEDVDMVILTLMDYLVLSVGSFGWWGAYLSDAREVMYYKNWPRNGSKMAEGIEPKDYFPANWIPFT